MGATFSRFCLRQICLSHSTTAGKVGNDFFGVFCLSGSRFTSNENRLIFLQIHHTLVRTLSNTKDVGWAFRSSFANVDFHATLSVDGEALVWIDSNTEKT